MTHVVHGLMHVLFYMGYRGCLTRTLTASESSASFVPLLRCSSSVPAGVLPG